MSAIASVRVKAIRRFTVRTVLPEPLAALGDLASNLRWSWHPPTRDLFAALDPQRWAERPAATRSGCSAPVSPAGSPRLAADDGVPRAGSHAAADDLQTLPAPSRAGTSAGWRRRRRRPARDRLLLARSSASPRCCRSTPAASASSPATT